jgi:hypothetical protein
MRRALRYDGVLAYTTRGEVTSEDVRAIRGYVEENRAGGAPFDIVCEGYTPGEDPEEDAATVRSFARAGATRWIDGSV